jgi:hypothetical protein
LKKQIISVFEPM